MGEVLLFPHERRQPCVADYREEPAIILILPMVRIERCEDPTLTAFNELRACYGIPPIIVGPS